VLTEARIGHLYFATAYDSLAALFFTIPPMGADDVAGERCTDQKSLPGQSLWALSIDLQGPAVLSCRDLAVPLGCDVPGVIGKHDTVYLPTSHSVVKLELGSGKAKRAKLPLLSKALFEAGAFGGTTDMCPSIIHDGGLSVVALLAPGGTLLLVLDDVL